MAREGCACACALVWACFQEPLLNAASTIDPMAGLLGTTAASGAGAGQQGTGGAAAATTAAATNDAAGDGDGATGPTPNAAPLPNPWGGAAPAAAGTTPSAAQSAMGLGAGLPPGLAGLGGAGLLGGMPSNPEAMMQVWWGASACKDDHLLVSEALHGPRMRRTLPCFGPTPAPRCTTSVTSAVWSVFCVFCVLCRQLQAMQAMQNPAMRSMVSSLMSTPGVVDQMLASNPELQAVRTYSLAHKIAQGVRCNEWKKTCIW